MPFEVFFSRRRLRSQGFRGAEPLFSVCRVVVESWHQTGVACCCENCEAQPSNSKHQVCLCLAARRWWTHEWVALKSAPSASLRCRIAAAELVNTPQGEPSRLYTHIPQHAYHYRSARRCPRQMTQNSNRARSWILPSRSASEDLLARSCVYETGRKCWFWGGDKGDMN